MKKTLIALSVLVAAGSVNAADVYNKDDVAVSLGGAAEIQYYQGYTKSSDPKIRLDDGELNFGVSVKVNDTVNAIGKFDFEFEGGDTTENTELWAGFETEFGTITFGRQYTIGDDAGIGSDYELGKEQVSLGDAHGDEVIKYKFSNDMFYAGIAHNLGDRDANTADVQITDGNIGVTVAGLDARVFVYQEEKTTLGVTTEERDGYNLEAVYSMDAFSVGLSYGEVEVDDQTVKTDITFTELMGKYTMGKNTFALGYIMGESDAAGSTAVDVDVWYANVTHKLHSNVRVYAEIGDKDHDVTKSDFGYVAGMEVKF